MRVPFGIKEMRKGRNHRIQGRDIDRVHVTAQRER